jgi:hypothetical protein
MTWHIPKLWEGGECWILGGGPSLTRQFDIPDEVVQGVLRKELPLSAYSPYMSAIHKKHVIAVNTAFRIGDWIDMVFWGDKKWFLINRHKVAAFKGLKVTCHPYFANGRFAGENIKHLIKDNTHPQGISSRASAVSWNSNSGSAAISIAVQMGATKIILVGFDMKLDEVHKQHWHSEYGVMNRKNATPRSLPFHRHLIGFPHIARDAKRMGITIVNACPDSAITSFPKMPVKDILKGKPIIPVPVDENLPERRRSRNIEERNKLREKRRR